jgi:hypothetical protein
MRDFSNRLFGFLAPLLLPLAALIVLYLCYDPFRVLYDYNDYSYPEVTSNRDYVSTEMFKKNNKKRRYNSFVLGSSRTMAFLPSSWKNYLSTQDMPFMFDASNESIYGIYIKLKYLDSINTNIDNVLIVLCRDISFATSSDQPGHLFRKHPDLTHRSWLGFQNDFLKAFLNPRFLFCYATYKAAGDYKSYMRGYIENREITFDTVTNAFRLLNLERELQDPTTYYSKRKDIFYKRYGEHVDVLQRISKEQFKMMLEIRRILEKNRTQFRVVLSPLYEQIKFSLEDMVKLKTAFGENLFDFSGKNHLTDNVINYYEQSHYRPSVGDSIFKTIYRDSFYSKLRKK